MYILINILSIFMIFLCNSQFIYRLAEPNDIRTILELDKRVSYEFFAPVYAAHYANWDFGKNPESYISKELQMDEELFPQIIRRQYLEDPGLEYRMFCSFEPNGICRALLLIEILKDAIELKLFYVDGCCRGKGLGRELFNIMKRCFSDYHNFFVYVFRYGNEKTLAFYESLGFKNAGPGPDNKISLYGVPYSEIFYKFAMKK